MQGYGRIIAPDFCVAHREANSGLSTLNRTKSILSIYHQQRQLQKQRGMCLNDTYPFCQQPLSGNCHSICFSKPVLWTATPRGELFRRFRRLIPVRRFVLSATAARRAETVTVLLLYSPVNCTKISGTVFDWNGKGEASWQSLWKTPNRRRL